MMDEVQRMHAFLEQGLLEGEVETKFAFFSGHDTVIAPLLAALGAYDCRWPPYASHVAFELWSKPSQAPNRKGGEDEGRRDRRLARRGLAGGADTAGDPEDEGDAVEADAGGEIESLADVGELAEGEFEGEDRMSEAGEMDGDPRDGDGKVEKGSDEEEEVYVRVTFNGEPVTHRITLCKYDANAEDALVKR